MNELEENITEPVQKTRTLEVRDWTNLNIGKWSQWGFNISGVLRTSKHHFLFQPAHPVIREILEPVKGIQLGGRWFRTNADIERTLEKTVWIAWFLSALVFALALIVFTMGIPLVSFALFVFMYALVEGFLPLMLARLASGSRISNLEVDFSSLTKVIHFQKSGIILVSWSDNGSVSGLAFKMTINSAEALASRIREQMSGDAEFTVETNANPFNPPDKRAVK